MVVLRVVEEKQLAVDWNWCAWVLLLGSLRSSFALSLKNALLDLTNPSFVDMHTYLPSLSPHKTYHRQRLSKYRLPICAKPLVTLRSSCQAYGIPIERMS